MANYLKGYSYYSFAKFLVAACFLLAVAVVRKTEIESYYTREQCTICANLAKENLDVYFEFATCAELYFPSIHSANLLHPAGVMDFSLNQSSVESYVVLGVIVLTLALLCGGGVVYISHRYARMGQRSTVLLLMMFLSFLVIVMLMMLCNTVYSLYMWKGCYVSVVGKDYVIGSQVLIAVFVIATFCQSLLSPTSNIRLYVALCALLALGGYTIYSLIVNLVDLLISNNPTPLVFTLLAFVSIFEIPLFLFGLHSLKDMVMLTITPNPDMLGPHLDQAGDDNSGRVPIAHDYVPVSSEDPDEVTNASAAESDGFDRLASRPFDDHLTLAASAQALFDGDEAAQDCPPQPSSSSLECI